MSFDIRRLILWQYENAENLQAILRVIQSEHDEIHAGFWDDWYNDVFNIDTANDFGLALWARLLDVKMSVEFLPQLDKKAFGFGANRKNYHPPSNFGARNGSSVALTREQKRIVLKARMFALTRRPTLDNINNFLRDNFGTGAFVTDGQDMSTMIYTFVLNVDGALKFLIENDDFLPRPAGVGSKIKIVKKVAFGFGKKRRNFAQPSNFGDLK